MVAKVSDRVVNPQCWPHVALRGEFITKNLSFHDLDFRLWIAGELEIVTARSVSLAERLGRLNLCKQLAYLYGGYSWDILRGVYASIVHQIEQGTLQWDQWDSEFLSQIQWSLVRTQAELRATGPTRSTNRNSAGNRSKSEDEVFFCKDFNKGSCSKGESHMGNYKGRRVQLSHICAKCWLADKAKHTHSERDTSCPKKSADSSA